MSYLPEPNLSDGYYINNPAVCPANFIFIYMLFCSDYLIEFLLLFKPNAFRPLYEIISVSLIGLFIAGELYQPIIFAVFKHRCKITNGILRAGAGIIVFKVIQAGILLQFNRRIHIIRRNNHFTVFLQRFVLTESFL